jgi:hypothetical protein
MDIKIAKLTSSYSEENYDMLFHQILEILKTIEDHYKWDYVRQASY